MASGTEPHPIRAGDYIRDNEPRKGGRMLRVDIVGSTHAACTMDETGRMVRVRLDRVHADGKSRTKGYSMVRP